MEGWGLGLKGRTTEPAEEYHREVCGRQAVSLMAYRLMKALEQRQRMLENAKNEDLRDLLITEVLYQRLEVRFVNNELAVMREWLVDLPGLNM